MKNKIFYLTLFILTNLLINLSYGNDQFIFDITEVEITENGNKFKGTKKGIVKTDNGLILIADEFEYDKTLNILNAKGNVKITDTINRKCVAIRLIHPLPGLGLGQHQPLAMAPAAAAREQAFVGATAADQPCTTR